MGRVKTFLAYTNPITIVVGAPVFVGIVLAAMLDGVARKTGKVVMALEKDVMK